MKTDIPEIIYQETHKKFDDIGDQTYSYMMELIKNNFKEEDIHYASLAVLSKLWNIFSNKY